MGSHCLWQMVSCSRKTRFMQGQFFTGRGVGLFKLMVSVENTRKEFVAMNEALKKELEAKVTEKLA